MQKLPVLQITKDAYNFIWTEAKRIFPLFAQYSASLILLYVFLHFIKEHFGNSIETETSVTFSLTLAIFGFLTLFLQTPVCITMIRSIANQEEIEKGFLKVLFTRRARKTFFTMLAIMGLCFVFLIPVILIFLILSKISSLISVNNALHTSLTLSMSFMTLLSMAHIFYRLLLAIPLAVLDHEKPIRHSWRLSKGHVLKILGIVFLTCLPGMIWTSLVNFLLDITLQNSPLAYGLLTLPQLYLGFALYASLGFIYKHLHK